PRVFRGLAAPARRYACLCLTLLFSLAILFSGCKSSEEEIWEEQGTNNGKVKGKGKGSGGTGSPNALYFSGTADNKVSAIYMIRTDKESEEPLDIYLDSTAEEVSFAIDTDLGAEGLLLTHTGDETDNSPAVVTIDGGKRVIALTGEGKGSVITVGSGVKLTLKNITFKGKDGNTAPLISVTSGGELVLEDGAVITGNNNTTGVGGSGVYVGVGGALVMNGGAISGNTSSANGGMFNGGGGVAVYSGGSFTMNDGEISDNTVITHGGGVYMQNDSTFTMNGGKISGNTAATNGGGAAVYGSSTFTMNKGEISGNTANGGSSYYGGGGVYVNATFIMTGGVISGNNTDYYGGGVLLRGSDSFTKTGGVIYGYTANDALSNWVGTRKVDGTRTTPDDHKADKGDVVYYYDGNTNHRETALGEGVVFNGDTGPW
ncbi:MAG: hypothetical protein LBK66_15010, partial [Spirochaetaceae bacterium]|nr:hypothetical protein [Spirochaetaceae bacterium]